MKNIPLDADQYRALQYFRQTMIVSFLGLGNNVTKCLRYPQGNVDQIGLILNGAGRAHYHNLQTCNLGWLCPICAAKISRKRRDQLTKAVNIMQERGAHTAFITYTVQHKASDSFETVRRWITDAHSQMHSHRQWSLIQERYGWLGSIKATEPLYGANGWHYHLHEIAFLDTNYERAEFERRLSDRWDNQLFRVGAAQIDGIGLTVKKADREVRKYITKWGLVPELTNYTSKGAAGGGVWPFQFADIVYREPDRYNWARDKYQEYSEGIAGAKRLLAGKEIRKIVKEVDAGVEKKDRLYPIVANLTLDQMRIITTTGKRVKCLMAIEDGSLDKFLRTVVQC